MNATRRNAGFTLLELIVSMSILTFFLLMLTQLLGTGVRVFEQGESSQALADRAQAAARTVEAELRALQGPRALLEQGAPEARLLVQWLPHALVQRPPESLTWCQLLRAEAALQPDQERELQAGMLRSQAMEEAGPQGEQAVAARLRQLVGATPPQGRCGLWLQPWPSGDQEGAWLDLRVGRFLPGQPIEVQRDQLIDPMTVPVPGGPELPGPIVERNTRVLLDGLLHVEWQFWSQRTTAWRSEAGQGAEIVWDSARAGWMLDSDAGPVFSMDLGPESLSDPTDDVYPHAIRCVLVVGQEMSRAPEGMLADELDHSANVLRLLNPDRFPGPDDGGYVKVGPEWMRYGSRSGGELRGLVRGLRGTKARVHLRGTGVRVGRTVDFTIPLAFARDDWNGGRR